MKLNRIDGKTVRDFVAWLKEQDCGCCHFHLCDTDTKAMHIVVGWHDVGNGEYQVAWKIGMESFANAMQCDFDIDFDMPYDTETGDVYDTCETIEGTPNWRSLAAEMNRAAKGAVAFQLEIEEKDAMAAA